MSMAKKLKYAKKRKKVSNPYKHLFDTHKVDKAPKPPQIEPLERSIEKKYGFST